MKKTIITVVGKDTVGIIAKVCTYLADNQVNILDITQTILDGCGFGHPGYRLGIRVGAWRGIWTEPAAV